MELLFVTLGGVILGILARYVLPRRGTHGVILVPAIGALASAVIWVALTWLGWPWDGGWIWAVTLVATAVIVAVVDLVLGRVREEADRRRLADLLSGRAPISSPAR
ncbi:hypothetical protein DVJ78_09940 [Humibacter sp. BT305]|uniref:Uncharacterized protein n=1 Tax=Cnuibacter physcomitrellae TaxID=1619308 RepID=A0A1X9LP03_9MICO|nr:hypothetical protein [Cnuibacter physcomitrellae]ARJ05691.1 hypothetical protein B5808_11005 [Cnuibacter physcomitrellae]AXH35682.1 hypothetical protein DVJ78_09940 [Humibacter sp. BT305]MCS5496599.1 hypothetical protein [Cnuibacter physcomitrellae]GGI36270.1 hypothetical protein GCM10010988_08110 [Cnuibacter physcomitrellae]